ncbi:MAG: hypothetical protein IJM66_02185 [Muribaculaceae bacterium]|nr:hypothetical protein [Muribaculaceae bacterium]
MNKFFSMLFSKDATSAFVDGTHISKYSEKVLNTLAIIIYYASLVTAILIVGAGIIAFISLLASAGNNPFRSASNDITFAISALIGSIYIASCIFGTGFIISSAIRVICNISLSLKLLTRTGNAQVQSSASAINHPHEDDSTTAACPECGCPVQQGIKSCPKQLESKAAEAKVENVGQPAPEVAEPKSEPKPTPVVAEHEPELKPDIMSTFTINDRFLFLRELFGGNSQQFNDAIGVIQRMSNIDQVQQFVTDVLQLDSSNDIVKEFIRLINLSFKK